MTTRSIRTVLFTDLVGSTETAERLGDRRWREVLAQHHAFVREQLRRFEGDEIATAGDGFLAVFEGPARALLCAVAIRDAVSDLGLSVRCGVHMGEVEATGETVGGIAVHIGARVAALAGADEILVSGTVRDVEAGSEFEFEDRGRHELKGVSGEWRVYVLTGIPDHAGELLPSPEPAPRGLWERARDARLGRVLVFYLMAALALVLATDALGSVLGLPGWVTPIAVALLAIGLLVVTATAWVQSLSRTRAGELPGGREIDLPGLFRSILDGEWPHLTWGRAVAGGAFAFALLFGLAGLYVVVQDRGQSFAPGEALAEDAAPGIAVLPFDVSSSGLSEWREGMVTLVSTALDGAGDLRAIDSRTVLAQWDRRVPGGSRADRETALDVARAMGARYALLGSAVAIGPELSLVAEIYDVEDGGRLGSVQVQGPPDDVLALVDDLTREVLSVILEEGEGEVPQVNLAALTTGSLPALKEYLQGEALFRRGEIDPAIESYERAVEADSTFALAWNRLATAYGWLEGGSDRILEFRDRALRHADRLPRRERLLVEGENHLNRGFSAGAERIRQATRRFPDDAELWFLLGELYYHHDTTIATLDEAEAAFERAVELDPSFAPYRFHLTEFAFMSPPDSALAAERLGELRRVSPEGRHVRAGEIALGLAFGDAATRAAFEDSLAAAEPELAQEVVQFLFHPRFWPVQERLIERLIEDHATPRAHTAFWGEITKSGQMGEALSHLDADVTTPPWFPVCVLAGFHTLGIPIPEEVMEERVAIRPSDVELSPRLVCGARYAVDEGRRADFDRALEVARVESRRRLETGDTLGYRMGSSLVNELEGYARWRGGDAAGALPLLEDAAAGSSNTFLVYWIGQIHLELGDAAEAIRHFRSLDNNPLALYYLGTAYEQAGDAERAEAAYASFVGYWSDADPELQPLVERARQGMIRTGGLRRQ